MSEEEILTGEILKKEIILISKTDFILASVGVFVLGALCAVAAMMAFFK